jgi:pimeloyl-ACP methyl ester carboxylesterase
MRSQARNAALDVLDAGHWPQIDAAAEVARIMLARSLKPRRRRPYCSPAPTR